MILASEQFSGNMLLRKENSKKHYKYGVQSRSQDFAKGGGGFFEV